MAETRWRIVLIACGAGVVGAFQIGKMPSSLPVLREDLELSLVAAGWVISMFNVIGVSAGIAVGAVADWLGHRRVMLFGLLSMAAGSLLGAAAADATTILASRFVEGLGSVVVFVAGPGLIVRAVRPDHMRLAFGVWGTYMPAGTGFMVLITPGLLTLVGWRGMWLVNAALLVLFAVWLALGTRDFRTRPRDGARQSLGTVLARLGRDIRLTLSVPGPVLLALCFATYTGTFLAVLAFLPTFLIEQQGATPLLAATLTAFAIAINVLGNLAGGWLLHHGAQRWVLIVIASTVMAAASLGIYADGLGLATRYGFCLVFSVVGGMLPASVLGAAPVHAPKGDLVATTNGLIVQGANLGQMIAPPALAALVAATGGWAISPALIITSSMLGVLFAAWIGIVERRQARTA